MSVLPWIKTGIVQRNPGELFYATAEEALDDVGYVLTYGTSGVKKATSDDIPVGVNFLSTINPVTQQAEAGRTISYVPLHSGFVVKVKKEAVALSKGTYVKVGSTAGVVTDAGSPPAVDTSNGDASALVKWLRQIVGVVVEDAAESDTHVKVLLI